LISFLTKSLHKNGVTGEKFIHVHSLIFKYFPFHFFLFDFAQNGIVWTFTTFCLKIKVMMWKVWETFGSVNYHTFSVENEKKYFLSLKCDFFLCTVVEESKVKENSWQIGLIIFSQIEFYLLLAPCRDNFVFQLTFSTNVILCWFFTAKSFSKYEQFYTNFLLTCVSDKRKIILIKLFNLLSINS